jgi:hypothetical protein
MYGFGADRQIQKYVMGCQDDTNAVELSNFVHSFASEVTKFFNVQTPKINEFLVVFDNEI